MIFNLITILYELDILPVGFKEDRLLHKVLGIYIHNNLKLNAQTCHFRCSRVPIFNKKLSRLSVKSDCRMINVVTDLLSPKRLQDLQSFLGIKTSLRKCSPNTAKICEPLAKLTSVLSEGMYN